MASFLTESVLTPSFPMINPRYSVSLWWNSHLNGLTSIPDFRIFSTMLRTSFQFCCRVFKYLNLSSRKTMQHMSMSAIRTSLIHCWNITSALHSPNGMTRSSYVPSRVEKVLFHSSPFLIRILWFASLMSRLVKYLAPPSLSRASLMRGCGCRSFLGTLLSDR